MTINKTQQFVYFQNKAKHFDNIKKAKTIVHDRLESTFRQSIDNKSNKTRFIPPLQQHAIKVENQSMINRVVNILSSNRTEVSVQGNYSRFNKVQRKFRYTNPFQQQLMRTIKISNERYKSRIQNAKPKIGSSREWIQHFGATLSLKRNMSRYLQSNRSKGSLHISNQKFVPHHYLSFIDETILNRQHPNQIQITKQGLLNLPDIKMKNITQIVYPKKNKLLIDKSKKSLQTHSLTNNNSIASLQIQKSKQLETQKRKNNNQSSLFTFKKEKKKFRYQNRQLNKSIQIPLKSELTKKYENPQQIQQNKTQKNSQKKENTKIEYQKNEQNQQTMPLNEQQNQLT